jgi:hypothetical protein
MGVIVVGKGGIDNGIRMIKKVMEFAAGIDDVIIVKSNIVNFT